MSNDSSKHKIPSQVNLTEEKNTIPGEPLARKTQRPLPWQPFLSVVWTLFLYVATQIVAAYILILGLTLAGWDQDRTLSWLEKAVSAQFLYILLAEALTIYAIVWLVKKRRRHTSAIGWTRLRRVHIWKAMQGFGAYIVLYIAIASLVGALVPSIDMEQDQQIGFESARSVTDLLFVFCSLVILPPLAEEIVFRGYLFTNLRSKLPYMHTAIITSGLFGIAHLQFGSGEPLLWIAAIDTFVLSLVLCYMREKTGSLWPPIFIHAMKNMVAFSFLFLFK